MKLNKENIAVASFAAKSPIRPELASVLLKGGKIVATDSFRLIEMEVEEYEGDVPVLIPAKEFKAMKGKVILGEKSEEGYKLSSDQMTLIVSANGDPESYPDYEKIIPTEEPVLEIKVNGRYLAEVLSLLAKTHPFETVELSFYGPKKGIVLHTAKARGIVMPQV